LATKKKKTTAKTGAAGRKTTAKKVEPADVARKTALAVASAALDNKALNVEIIDVRGKVDYADYVVIMSGRSDRHVAALARNIEDALRTLGQRCLGVEGLPKASWLLLDFGDVIVHVFHHDMRGYYDLERLWIDAARVAVEGG
jgi:ribosome-associated protein